MSHIKRRMDMEGLVDELRNGPSMRDYELELQRNDSHKSQLVREMAELTGIFGNAPKFDDWLKVFNERAEIERKARHNKILQAGLAKMLKVPPAQIDCAYL